jgi:hypothetical protein
MLSKLLRYAKVYAILNNKVMEVRKMIKYAVYEVLDSEVTDDTGRRSNLQFQSGNYPDRVTASKEASRLNKLYQGHYSFKVLEDK